MNTEIIFTGQEVFISAAFLFLFILSLIYGGRYYLAKKSTSNLQEKYRGKEFVSPLTARNKYPEMDVFNFSNQFLLLGLVISLLIAVAGFGFTSFEKKAVIPDNAMEMEEDIEIEPPRSAEPPPPPPPPPPPVITMIPDEAIIAEEDDIEFVDQSVDAETEIETPAPVQSNLDKEDLPPPPPPPPPPTPEVEEIFQVVEEMPRFPGCEGIATKEEKYACSTQKMLEFIYGNINFPNIARENNIQGTVVVRFVINKKGTVSDAELLRDIGGGCGEEALRIVNLMNEKNIRWYPGKQRGKPVKVRMNLPVKFKLIT